MALLGLTLVGCGGGNSNPPGGRADSGSAGAPVDAGAGGTSGTGGGGGAVAVDAAPAPDSGAPSDARPVDAPADGPSLLADATVNPDVAAIDATVMPDAAPAAACNAGARSEPPIKGPTAAMTDSDQTFRSLVVDPTNPDVVFVGSEGNGVFRTRDGGASWTWLRTGFRYDGFPAYAETWDLAISAARPGRIYAATTDSPGPVTGTWPSARGGVYRSDDGGDSWRQVGCLLENAKTASVWVDPTDADVVIAGVEGGEASFMPRPPLAYYPGGLWKSRDGGLTWTQLTLPAGHERNSFWRIARRGGKMWTFALDGRETPDKGLGFLASGDGMTFTALASPFAGKLVTGWDVSPDGMTILASVRDSFRLQRSTNGGATFDFVTAVDGARANGAIAYSPDGKVVLFASNNLLHRSEDGLASSVEVLNAPAFIEDLEFASNSVVYAAVRGLRVYRSGDGGKTWSPAGNLRADVIDK